MIDKNNHLPFSASDLNCVYMYAVIISIRLVSINTLDSQKQAAVWKTEHSCIIISVWL